AEIDHNRIGVDLAPDGGDGHDILCAMRFQRIVVNDVRPRGVYPMDDLQDLGGRQIVLRHDLEKCVNTRVNVAAARVPLETAVPGDPEQLAEVASDLFQPHRAGERI